MRQLYTEQLVRAGVLTGEEVRRIEGDLQHQLQQALDSIKTKPPEPDEPFEPRGAWSRLRAARAERSRPTTAVPVERLAQIAEALAAVPADFEVHTKLRTLLDRRRKVVAEDGPIDWATAEALAFGTLVVEGTPVRLSGQDSSRGTFSQRHAALVDQKTGHEYVPLDHVSETQARFEVWDSHLSEAAVLGFEYGYSIADPTTLTLWEAQFGDFANGAQRIIDQFVSSAHAKWGRMSGLVMLLPHGFEGQGPEHSSARPERFLQLCAEDNLQIANCTTPAQYFHVLRRQMRRPFRSPLVVFTPKSMLRSARATSRVEELANGLLRAGDGRPQRARSLRRAAPAACAAARSTTTSSAHREKRDGVAEGEARGDVGDRAARAALSVADRGARRDPRPLCARRAPGLGAGGAGEHGRLGVRARAAARAVAARVLVCRPQGGREPGGGLAARAPRGAGGVPGGRLRRARRPTDGRRSPRRARSRSACAPGDRDGRAARPLRLVAGADVSYDRGSPVLFAAVVVLDADSLEVVEVGAATARASFPYVPGYLSFRELPPLLAAFAKLRRAPDLVLCDGHGRAHPAASASPVISACCWTCRPIGVAKSRLVGEHREPGARRGAHTALRGRRRAIGEVLRTRDGVAPVYVSVGHRVSLATARRLVLSLHPALQVGRADSRGARGGEPAAPRCSARP